MPSSIGRHTDPYEQKERKNPIPNTLQKSENPYKTHHHTTTNTTVQTSFNKTQTLVHEHFSTPSTFPALGHGPDRIIIARAAVVAPYKVAFYTHDPHLSNAHRNAPRYDDALRAPSRASRRGRLASRRVDSDPDSDAWRRIRARAHRARDRGWARALGATTTTATTREAIVDATR